MVNEFRSNQFSVSYKYQLVLGDIRVPVIEVSENTSEAKINDDDNIMGCMGPGRSVRCNVAVSPEKFGSITVKVPCIMNDRQLADWFSQCISPDGRAVNSASAKKEGSIFYFNESDDPVGVLHFRGAIPKKRSRDKVNSKEGSILTDSYEFAVEMTYWENIGG